MGRLSPNPLIEYSAYLTFQDIGEIGVETVFQEAQRLNLSPDIGRTYLELDYSWRDTDQQMVRFLAAIAEIIVTANGEVSCTIDKEPGDPLFEFYMIRSGKLFRQQGHVVRGLIEPVEFQ